jgi:type I restriction enzyme S subunit
MKPKNNNLPKGWRKVKLGEIAKVETGGTPSRRNPKYFKGGKIPWLKTQELNDGYIYDSEEKITEEALMHSNAKLFPVNTVLIAMYGATVGKLGYLKTECSTNQAFAALLPNPQVYDSKFLFYLLLKERDRLISVASGAAQQNLNLSIIKNFEIFIPEDINEQKRIADILSAFDDKIELNNKIIKTLEEMAQEIFKEWFVKNQKSKIKNQKLGDLANIKYGQGPASSKLKRSGYPVYGANGIIGYSDSYDFPDRQIIIGCRGVVGNVTLTLPKCTVTHNCLVITPRNNRKIFFYYLLKNQNLDSVVSGSAQPQITIRNLEQFELAMPEEKLQNKFESIVGDIEQKRLVLFYENQKLAELRDLLLPKLMSGEIRV